MATASNFDLDKRHSVSVQRRESAFEAESAKAAGEKYKRKSGGSLTLVNLSGKVDYVLVSETAIAELKLTLGWKKDKDGKKHYRTFIHESSFEKANAYLTKQRKMNSDFIVQPETVIVDTKGGYFSVTHQQLNAFCFYGLRERAANWSISKVYSTLRGIGFGLQYLCTDGNSAHGDLENGIFFDENDHVVLHRVSPIANTLNGDVKVFQRIIDDLVEVVKNKMPQTAEENHKLQMIMVYTGFLKKYRDPSLVKFDKVRPNTKSGTTNWHVRPSGVNWNFLLLFHFFFWDDRNEATARFVRNLHKSFRSLSPSLEASKVFKTYIAEFQNWESEVTCTIGKRVLAFMNKNRSSSKKSREAIEVIDFCNNYIKHYNEHARNTRSATKEEPEIIDELLKQLPSFLECMYEAYMRAVGCWEYSAVLPKDMLLHNV